MTRVDSLPIWLAVSGFAAVAGCGNGDDAQTRTSDGGSDSTAALDAPLATDAGAVDAPFEAGATTAAITFSYRPGWTGVQKVEVVGGFGLPSDWSKNASFLTLADNGTGNFAGSASLPSSPGYLYLFRVTGDAAATDPKTFTRYAVDPSNAAFSACPSQSPTFSKTDVNPCSALVVPQASLAPSPIHVKGSLTVDGNSATGWLVVLERDEPMSHHFFANRITVGADGAFDVAGSVGSYRLQALYPTYLSETDLQRDPANLSALRRAISGAFSLRSADLTVTAPDLAFHAYGQFAPAGDGGSLPTVFSFEDGAPTRLDVYGGPGDGGIGEIGDPWYSSAPTLDGGTTFDGSFNTKQATQTAVVSGTRYLWGTEEPFDASVMWTKQTMVLPISWH
jgi:hypothetical protein